MIVAIPRPATQMFQEPKSNRGRGGGHREHGQHYQSRKDRQQHRSRDDVAHRAVVDGELGFDRRRIER